MSARDRIVLRDVELHALIGVYAHERAAPRRLRLQLELACDARRAAATDALADTLDYDAIVQRLRLLAVQERPALLETFAQRIAAVLHDEFGVAALRLRLEKPGAVPGAAWVGIALERGDWAG